MEPNETERRLEKLAKGIGYVVLAIVFISALYLGVPLVMALPVVILQGIFHLLGIG